MDGVTVRTFRRVEFKVFGSDHTAKTTVIRPPRGHLYTSRCVEHVKEQYLAAVREAFPHQQFTAVRTGPASFNVIPR